MRMHIHQPRENRQTLGVYNHSSLSLNVISYLFNSAVLNMNIRPAVQAVRRAYNSAVLNY